MYSKRIRIFIAICSIFLLACIYRLAQMQLFPHSSIQVEIERLKNAGAKTQNLSTVRGSILDRKGNILAEDIPTFGLNIDYQLSQYWDPNYLKCRRLLAKEDTDPNKPYETDIEIQNKAEQIKTIMERCDRFGFQIYEIQEKIEFINKKIWDMRYYLAWKNKTTTKPFEEVVPDPNARLLMAYDFRIPAMYESYPLFELETDDDVFTAEFEFMDIDGIEVASNGKRYYPYGNIAAQTIGWVGRVPESNTLFEEDNLMSYLLEDVCGREDGVEYVCEPYLRGRRGEVYFDIDKQLIRRTDAREGSDVVLTLDIKLQEKIENYMSTYQIEDNPEPNMAAVVIEVETGDILAMVSIPDYNNNRTRYDWSELSKDPGKPLINRALNAYYPPGSIVKPLILVAGMEEGLITSNEVISCPSHAPETGWPRCMIFRNSGVGHDIKWQNTARNAIKGSCNIYFSQLADMLDSASLQNWLYGFGYGHKNLVPPPFFSDYPDYSKNIRQLAGTISTKNPDSSDTPLEEMPPIFDRDKKFFGIGQSNLRVTPLQAANSMAVLARGGVYMNPRLFLDRHLVPESKKIPLNISQHTIDTVYDGMYAVVNETSGTAYTQFSPTLNTYREQDIKIYGKTGSTEGPEHAWFGGFAIDGSGRKIAFAVVVEGGQHGSSDAAPLANEILHFTMEAGYIGNQ